MVWERRPQKLARQKQRRKGQVGYFANQLTARVQAYSFTRQPTQLTCPQLNRCILSRAEMELALRFRACEAPTKGQAPTRGRDYSGLRVSTRDRRASTGTRRSSERNI